MIHCKELSDKVVRLLTIYENGTYGPEVHIEFTDGTTFSACLKTNVSIEAKYIHGRIRGSQFRCWLESVSSAHSFGLNGTMNTQ
jgi:hypothetical protein